MSKLYDVINKTINAPSMEEAEQILFGSNGIVINSCNIKFRKEIRDEFKEMNIYNKYNNLVLYESHIHYNKNFSKIFENLEIDKISILDLIGNNGKINKNEFKNIFKNSMFNFSRFLIKY